MGQSSQVIHDFKQDLDWSQKASDEQFWQKVYSKAFPNMTNCVSCIDLDAQKQGVDRLIYLSSGDVVKIDEKKRREMHDDILLEYAHSSGVAGWIEKDLSIDYLAYAFMPIRKVYLFPLLILRRAWLKKNKLWKSTCQLVKSYNRQYITFSVAVPIEVLRSEITSASIVTVQI